MIVTFDFLLRAPLRLFSLARTISLSLAIDSLPNVASCMQPLVLHNLAQMRVPKNQLTTLFSQAWDTKKVRKNEHEGNADRTRS
ncbi:hypothetical protein F5880DRAFT_491293 [Lentinula raphanica]|nr:hypothetical protein F5880DRAFT_491293 [Lentinula raphanica]